MEERDYTYQTDAGGKKKGDTVRQIKVRGVWRNEDTPIAEEERARNAGPCRGALNDTAAVKEMLMPTRPPVAPGMCHGFAWQQNCTLAAGHPGPCLFD